MKNQRCDEDLAGVTLRQLLDLKPTAGPDQPVWLSDGSGIAIKSTRAGKPAIRLVDPADGAQRDLVTDMGSLPFLSSPLLSVSPNGRWVAYVGDNGTADGREQSSRVEIRLHPVGGGDSLQLTHINANMNQIAQLQEEENEEEMIIHVRMHNDLLQLREQITSQFKSVVLKV